MAHTISGASLENINEKVGETPGYHPFEAEILSSDWSLEAGDTINIRRGDIQYTSPVTNIRNVWQGTSKATANSTGSKTRGSITKQQQRLYNRGGSAIRSQEHFYREFHSEDGYLHSYVEMTESYLRTEFDDDMNSLRGEFEMTASHLRTEFDDGMNSLRGEFEVTASHLRTEFDDGMNSLRGEFEVTASHLRTEFDDGMNSLRGEFEVTASHLRTEFDDGINSLHGELELTASRLQTTFENEVSGVRSQVTQQADYIGLLVDTTDPSNPSIKAGEIAVEMNKEGSVARINANRIKIGGAGSNVTLNDVLSITNNVAQFKENVYFQKEVTIANTNNSALNLYTMNFVGSSTYTLTPVVVGKMVKSISKNDSTGLVTVTLFDGSTVDFRHAASGGDYVTGSWGGGALTVSATPTGESAFIRSFTCGTVDWISNKIADVYVTALKTESGSIITEDDVFSIYVDTEYSYNEGYSSAHVKGTWNNNVFTYQKTNDSGYTNSNSVTISSAVAMQLGECYAYATWVSPSSSTPTSIYGTSKKLTIVDSTDNTVKLQSAGADVGLTYTHNKYTAGYNSAHVKGTWSDNVFTYQKTNDSGYSNSDSVTINSVVAMQQGECYVYATRTSASSSTPTSIYGTSKKLTIVDSGNNAVKLQSGGTDVGLTFTHNKYTAGQQSITSNGKAAATYYTSTSAQTISGGQYLSGAQTIAAVTTSNIYVGNIKAGVVVKVGDSGNDGRIKNVTGTFTSDGTAAAGHILSGKIAYVNGNKITGTIASKSAATYYTSTSSQTISSGQYLSGNQTIAAVSTSNIDAGNIKAGVTVKVGDSSNLGRIKNVTGTFTSDATAAAGVIFSGYTAYVNGSKVTGTADWAARYREGYIDGWAAYYNDSHWQSNYYNSSTKKYECWIPSGTVTWNGSSWVSAWDYSTGSNGWFQYSSGGASHAISVTTYTSGYYDAGETGAKSAAAQAMQCSQNNLDYRKLKSSPTRWTWCKASCGGSVKYVLIGF